MTVHCKGFSKQHMKNIENIEKDLARNLYFIDLKNEQNAENIMQVFAEFFFPFGRFIGTIDHLFTVPMGETSSFVKENNIISPSWLHQHFNYGDTRGLVCMHFLAALNIYFGGNCTLSKDVMSEFFHNLSVQALSICNKSIVLISNAIKKLNKNINDLVNTKFICRKKEP